MKKQIEKKYYIVLPILALMVFSIVGISRNQEQNQVNSQDTLIRYSSNVCTSVLRADGNKEELGCSSNLLTTAGKNLIKNYLGTSQGDSVDYIALCNQTLGTASGGCSDPAVGNTTLSSEYTQGGLARAQGTYLSNSDGNWSITYTFTATDDALETNMTGLFNASSDGTLFALNTFTDVTLQTNDQLSVNWTIGTS